ncbi:unnamed protein product [Clonostachys rosea f. rosea IK726]|uniref:Uncharacterized protein n=1 Tax=Clonostachys rosea f. rosea IK726 TaxID=1349383 RepID=A0ACA9U6H7_BIOOC|nr:unnamed protein product [Clonostachys rosea f. rosea IK726]
MSQNPHQKSTAADQTPNEIWEAILEPFKAEVPVQLWARPVTQNDAENTRTLASMSKVSHAAHPVAKQLLYQTLDLESLEKPRVSAVSLLRALADQPNLGKHVKMLRLNSSKLVASEGDEIKWDELFESVEARIRAPGLKGEVRQCLQMWLATTRKNRDFSDIATPFVSLLPGLQLLECQVKRWDPLVGYLKNFPSLTEVRLKATTETQPVSIVEILPALMHPTLKVVRLDGFGSDKKFGGNLRSNDSVETVDLGDSYVNINGISGLFQLFPNMKNFSYEFGSPQRMGGYDRPHIKIRELGGKLREVGRNLESLTIDTVVLFQSDENDDSALGSFKGMKSLKHLCVCKDFFIKREEGQDEAGAWNNAFPSQLESIHFLPESRISAASFAPWKDMGLLRLVGKYLLNKEGRLKSLKKVSVELHSSEAQLEDENGEVVEDWFGEWKITRKQEWVSMVPSILYGGKYKPTIVEFIRS